MKAVNDQRLSEATQVWLREAARDLRQRSTSTERLLWNALRNRQLDGLRFRRQHPIGPYIVDVLCFEARIVIEIDGPIHAQQQAYDAERDDHLNQLGYRVLRISSDAVDTNLEAVLSTIATACKAPPLPRAGEGAGG